MRSDGWGRLGGEQRKCLGELQDPADDSVWVADREHHAAACRVALGAENDAERAAVEHEYLVKIDLDGGCRQAERAAEYVAGLLVRCEIEFSGEFNVDAASWSPGMGGQVHGRRPFAPVGGSK